MIKPLTSFRFIFAFMVFFSHLEFLNNSKIEELRWISHYIFYEGYIGVSFFFILSGFVLAYNYQSKLLFNKVQIKKFYTARIARIFPLHVLTFIISIPLTSSVFFENKILWILQAITNFTLIQSFIPSRSFYLSFNAPSWSISCEFFFYIIFPILIFFYTKYKKFWILVLIIVLVLPFLSFLPFFTSEKLYNAFFYINPFFRIIDFFIGILIYNLYQNVINENIKLNYNFLEIGSIFLFLLFFAFHYFIIYYARYSFYYWIPISFLVFSFSFQKGFISKILSQKIFVYLGEISFAFYLFHRLILIYFIKFNHLYIGIENDILIVIIVFITSIIISHLSYKYFEIPFKKYLKNR
jgi:peptidoglycan/LPS O-acetylase OafA/YrhL